MLDFGDANSSKNSHKISLAELRSSFTPRLRSLQQHLAALKYSCVPGVEEDIMPSKLTQITSQAYLTLNQQIATQENYKMRGSPRVICQMFFSRKFLLAISALERGLSGV